MFTTADGWGTFEQIRQEDRQIHTVDVKWGHLAVRSLTLQVPEGRTAKSVTVTGAEGEVSISQQGRQVLLELASEATIPAGKALRIEIVT